MGTADQKPGKKALPEGLTLGGVGTVVSTLVAFGYDTAFLMVAAGLFAAAVAVLVLSRYWTTESKILEGVGGRPASVPVIQPWMRTTAKWVIVVELFLLPFVGSYWTSLFPLARIDSFAGSVHTEGSGEFFIRQNPLTVRTPDGKAYDAYPALALTVAKTSSPRVRVNSVRVIANRFEATVTKPLSGAYPENVIGVNTFQATIPPSGGTAEAEMIRDGKPTEGIVVLDDSHSFARFHIRLTGEKSGVFAAYVELDVSDDSGGRQRLLRTRTQVLTSIHGSSEDEEAGKK